MQHSTTAPDWGHYTGFTGGSEGSVTWLDWKAEEMDLGSLAAFVGGLFTFNLKT